MIAEVFTVMADGMRYTGWSKVSVSAAMNKATREFSIETTEQVGSWNFPPGTAVQIYTNGDLLVDGYTNSYEADADKDSHKITIKGRGKGQDIVDGAADTETGYWEDKDPSEIGRDLDQYGVGIKADVPLDKVRYWQVAPGETVFRNLERILRPQGATLMGEADGSVKITNASKALPMMGALVEGVNVEKCKVTLTDKDRFSEYEVRGQRRLGAGEKNLRVRRTARDSRVKRKRKKIIVAESETDDARAQKRADHERERAAGKSTTGTVWVPGCRDDFGDLYSPNRIVYVHAPILMKLSQSMLIETVEWSQDKDSPGTQTEIGLVDPRAYKGKSGGGKGRSGAENWQPPSGAKSDPAWRF
jgi:prophage tail gpP-like protein